METSTAPTQAAVEASNQLEEEPSSVLETLCHPDLTAMQQHILDDGSGRYSLLRKYWIFLLALMQLRICGALLIIAILLIVLRCPLLRFAVCTWAI